MHVGTMPIDITAFIAFLIIVNTIIGARLSEPQTSGTLLCMYMCVCLSVCLQPCIIYLKLTL